MNEDMKIDAIICVAQILLPQGGSEDDMLKSIAMADKMVQIFSPVDILWLISKAAERAEKGGEE